MMQNYLIPECHYEQEMLFILGYSKFEINKASGCNGVITEIKNSYKQKTAIGWIDQDPTKQVNRHPDYHHYKSLESKYKIHLKRKLGTNHFLIEIQDEFEVWIEPLGKAKKIAKEDFGIRNPLHEYSKVLIPKNVQNYLREVIKVNAEPFDYIRIVIENIKGDKYSQY
jgi:hypothetical protein